MGSKTNRLYALSVAIGSHAVCMYMHTVGGTLV